jgi:hypothetical protein
MEAKHLKVGDVRAALAELTIWQLTATAYLAAGDKLEPVEGGGGYYTLVDAGYTPVDGSTKVTPADMDAIKNIGLDLAPVKSPNPRYAGHIGCVDTLQTAVLGSELYRLFGAEPTKLIAVIERLLHVEVPPYKTHYYVDMLQEQMRHATKQMGQATKPHVAPHVAIVMQGGLIHQTCANQNVTVTVVDTDVDGVDDDRIVDVDGWGACDCR